MEPTRNNQNNKHAFFNGTSHPKRASATENDLNAINRNGIFPNFNTLFRESTNYINSVITTPNCVNRIPNSYFESVPNNVHLPSSSISWNDSFPSHKYTNVSSCTVSRPNKRKHPILESYNTNATPDCHSENAPNNPRLHISSISRNDMLKSQKYPNVSTCTVSRNNIPELPKSELYNTNTTLNCNSESIPNNAHLPSSSISRNDRFASQKYSNVSTCTVPQNNIRKRKISESNLNFESVKYNECIPSNSIRRNDRFASQKYSNVPTCTAPRFNIRKRKISESNFNFENVKYNACLPSSSICQNNRFASQKYPKVSTCKISRNDITDHPKSKSYNVMRTLPQHSNSYFSSIPLIKHIATPGSSNIVENLNTYKNSALSCSFLNNQHQGSIAANISGHTNNLPPVPHIVSWNPTNSDRPLLIPLNHCNTATNINTGTSRKTELGMSTSTSSAPTIFHIPNCELSHKIIRRERQRSRKRRLEESEDSKKPKSNGVCAICLEGLDFLATSDENKVMSTQCGHLFCKSCIVPALKRRQKCPTCLRHQMICNIHPVYL